MKRLLTFLYILAAAMAVYADDVAAYRLKVENFCELTVVDGVAVEYYCRPDSAGWAVFYTTPEKASKIMFENKAEHLTVQSAADESPIPGLPTIRVYSAALNKVENSGDSLLRVNIPIHLETLKARQIGNGRIEITGVDADYVEGSVTAGHGELSIQGNATKAKFKNVSTGPIDASALKTKQGNCFIFGTGDIDCAPSEQLRVYGAGSGKVIHHSDPKKITNRGIGVKILSANAQ